jgi:DNA topoisomerase-1
VPRAGAMGRSSGMAALNDGANDSVNYGVERALQYDAASMPASKTCALALAPLLHDGAAAARAAHLRYTSVTRSGYTRKRSGRSFAYYDSAGHRVRHRAVVERIDSLAIPPAWRKVWISASPQAHLQATGQDARGRKQYKYHPRFRALREAAKFDHIRRFGECLPRLRAHLRGDLARRGPSKRKVAALVVELMQRTCARVGNECYAEENGSYGLTTLRNRHAQIHGAHLRLKFKGKGGKVHDVEVEDARLARNVRGCRDLPGGHLFQYAGADGRYHPLSSADINDYLRESTGETFSAKDFRTWNATVLAVRALGANQPCSTARAAKQAVKLALEAVASELGNTVAICRKSYVHPSVIGQFTAGELHARVRRAQSAARRRPVRGLRVSEAIALHWLRALPKTRALE